MTIWTGLRRISHRQANLTHCVFEECHLPGGGEDGFYP